MAECRRTFQISNLKSEISDWTACSTHSYVRSEISDFGFEISKFLQNLPCTSGTAHPEGIPLRVGKHENHGNQAETDKQPGYQQHNAAQPDIDQAGYDRQADTRDRQDHASEEVGDELFESVHVRRVNADP